MAAKPVKKRLRDMDSDDQVDWYNRQAEIVQDKIKTPSDKPGCNYRDKLTKIKTPTKKIYRKQTAKHPITVAY
eukprot:6376932-Amphidinium_carterae.1